MDSTSRVIVYPASGAGNSPSTTTAGTFITSAGGQAALVSGTNIKTINGASVLGSGDLTVSGSAAWGSITGTLSSQTDLQSALDAKQATLVSATNIKTVNGSSLLGSGNLVVSSGYTLVATLSGNQATGANTTPVTLTNLVWTYAANSIYFFRWIGSVQSAAATTGCGFQLDVSTAVTEIAMTFFHQLANTGTLTGGSSIADDASVGVSSGVPTLNVSVPVSGSGMLRTGVNTGTAQLRFRSETSAVTTAMAGMTLVVEKVA